MLLMFMAFWEMVLNAWSGFAAMPLKLPGPEPVTISGRETPSSPSVATDATAADWTTFSSEIDLGPRLLGAALAFLRAISQVNFDLPYYLQELRIFLFRP